MALSAARLRWRRVRLVTAYTVAGVLIALGVVIGIASRLLPWLAEDPARVASFVAQRTGREIAIGELQARWHRTGPRLDVRQLEIGTGPDRVVIDTASIDIDVYSALLPDRTGIALQVVGPTVELIEQADGRWQVGGIARTGNPDDGSLQGFDELRVAAGTLEIRSERLGIDIAIPTIDGRVRLGDDIAFGFRAAMQAGKGLQITGRIDRDRRSGEFYAGGDDLDFGAWLAGLRWRGVGVQDGRGALGLWLTLADGRVTALSLDSDLEGLVLQREPETSAAPGTAVRVAIDRLRTRADYDEADGRWTLRVPEIEMVAALQHDADDAVDAVTDLADAAGPPGSIHGEGDDVAGSILIDAVDIAPCLQLLRLDPTTPGRVAQWLEAARPEGIAGPIQINIDDGSISEITGSIEALATTATDDMPSLQGARMDIAGDATAIVGTVTEQTWRLAGDGVVAAPLDVAAKGRLVLYRHGPAVALGIAPLRLRHDSLRLTLDGFVAFGADPYVDLTGRVSAADIRQVNAALPVGLMPETVVLGLKRALQLGRLRNGRFAVAGDPHRFPFADGGGHVTASAAIDRLTLDYSEGWPEGRDLQGTLALDGADLSMTAAGKMGDVPVQAVEARIANLNHAELELSLSSKSDAAPLWAFVRTSPIGESFADSMADVTMAGPVETRLKMHGPLHDDDAPLTVLGEVDFGGVELRADSQGLALADLRGAGTFDEGGFTAPALELRWHDRPAKLAFAAGDAAAGPDRWLSVTLAGEFALNELLAPYPSLESIATALHGAAPMTLALGIAKTTSGRGLDPTSAGATLEVASLLNGIEIDLPAPLRKDAATTMPATLSLELPPTDAAFELNLGHLLQLVGTLPADGPMIGVAAFGGAAVEPRPQRGLAIRGSVPLVDLGGWAGLLSGGGTGGAFELADVDLSAGELDVLDRGFPDTQIRIVPTPEKDLRIRLSGAALAGEVVLPAKMTSDSVIRADLERVYWPRRSAGMPADADADALVEPKLDARIDPSRIPALKLVAADARFGDADLGRFELLTYPTPEGMHIERLRGVGPALELNASGDWTRIDGEHQSRLAINFESPAIGGMLEALGFSEAVEGGATKAKLIAGWTGPPSSFSLARLRGTLAVDIAEGRIPEINPGAGRVLGLLSITAIPRRLSLDFRDFFQRGFAFDSIRGEFKIADGVATTEKTLIEAPAARMIISGDALLARREYDQLLEVFPRAGGVLPIIGAIAAGPAGAAVGAVAQAIFRQPIGEVAKSRYRIQGSFADPQVEKLRGGDDSG